jgi:nucleotide-binding universal stress UspA family protein
MPIRSILVAVGPEPAACAACRLAFLMARKHGAHVAGALWHGPAPLATRWRGFLTEDLATMLAERDAREVARIGEAFRTLATREAPPLGASFGDLGGETGASLAAAARGHDIVVMQRRPDDAASAQFSARPDIVALRGGRPVVIAPDGFAADALNERAVVAWDGRRAAARALGDAMHILESKSHVTVLTVGDDGPDGADVMALLARHGVPAERRTAPVARGGVAAAILDACETEGAGLLVMGAYEHSKFSEDVLGGVTRDILDGARLPVLMAH